jgi:hypothetical protein
MAHSAVRSQFLYLRHTKLHSQTLRISVLPHSKFIWAKVY